MSKLSRIFGWALISPAILLLLPAEARAQSYGDRQAVEEAVLDYVEGIYLVQPERIERSVSKPARTYRAQCQQGSSQARLLASGQLRRIPVDADDIPGVV